MFAKNIKAAQDPPFSTSFDCPEASILYNNADNWQGCGLMEWWGNGECYCDYGDMINSCSSSCGQHSWINAPGIFSAANNPLGSGNGFREWIWTNSAGTATDYDVNIIPGYYTFSTPQKELWIRWYMRFQSGIDIANTYYMKTMYIRAQNGGQSQCVPDFGPGADSFTLVAQGGGGSNYAGQDDANCSGCGLRTMSSGTGITDGTWHSLELHIKMDTNGGSGRAANGIAQFWLDGILKIDNSSINWSNGDAISQEGWIWFDFPNNISTGSGEQLLTGGQEMYIDWDDVSVANTAPAKRDAQGNPMIGPLDWEENDDMTLPNIPLGLNIS